MAAKQRRTRHTYSTPPDKASRSVREAAPLPWGVEAPRKKNLRLHQSKIDEARAILGTETETATIEAALDLVVFRKELVDGVRAMSGAMLRNVFDAAVDEGA